jgi:plastocyanin
MRKHMLLFVVLLSVALVGAACGNDEPTTTGTSTPTESPTETPSESPSAADDEVQVAMQDFMFSPADITIASGGKVELTNTGQAPHTFTLTDTDVDVEVQPGEDASVDITLSPGTYELMCRFHAGQGMVGTLTVTG